MCGIAGVIAGPKAAEEAVPKMLAVLTHRGPDDRGIVLRQVNGGFVGLGHVRLAILDLSTAGRQPMQHPASGSILVYNGEIYNFRYLRADLERDGDRFHGGSDTEVLLAGLVRYGPAFLPRLEGMYAFAFLDPRDATILLARDPAGIKPLYLAECATGLVFASETRALLASGLVPYQLDPRGIAGFLAYGAVQHPLTLFEAITSLAPGAYQRIRVGENGLSSKVGAATPFWRLPEPNPSITEAEAVAATRDALPAAVKDHLVADVPVGLFLSSGIDSTILAGLAVQAAPGLRSFTVTLPEQPSLNEKHLAAETAALFGLAHTEIPVSMAEAQDAVGAWLAVQDQPSIDGLNVFILSRAVREQGIKVALSGLGADEVFGGYRSFQDVPRLRRLSWLLRGLPPKNRWGFAGVAGKERSRHLRDKLEESFACEGSVRSVYLHRRRVLSDRQLAALGLNAQNLGLGPDFLPDGAAPDVDPDERDAVRLVSQFEFRHYQGNMLLRDGDANGMAFGLEIRVPFLARRVLDLAHGLPGRVRLPPGAPGKYLLRKTFPELLRPAILSQPKRGFDLPIARWTAGVLRPGCEEALAALKGTGLLPPAGVDAVWEDFLREPDSLAWTRVLALVVLGVFVERLGKARAIPPARG